MTGPENKFFAFSSSISLSLHQKVNRFSLFLAKLTDKAHEREKNLFKFDAQINDPTEK